MPPGELLIDTSGWIEYLRGTTIGETVASQIEASKAVTLNLVMAELSYVLHCQLKDEDEIDRQLERVRFLSRVEGFSDEEAVLAGIIKADLEQTQNRKGSYCDCVQIAVARGRGAKVLSKDGIFKVVPEGLYIGED